MYTNIHKHQRTPRVGHAPSTPTVTSSRCRRLYAPPLHRSVIWLRAYTSSRRRCGKGGGRREARAGVSPSAERSFYVRCGAAPPPDRRLLSSQSTRLSANIYHYLLAPFTQLNI
jgi:hypothetical protein